MGKSIINHKIRLLVDDEVGNCFLQADVEVGTGGIRLNCSLVESIQVKAVPSAFSMRFTDIGLNMLDLGSSKWKDVQVK